MSCSEQGACTKSIRLTKRRTFSVPPRPPPHTPCALSLVSDWIMAEKVSGNVCLWTVAVSGAAEDDWLESLKRNQTVIIPQWAQGPWRGSTYSSWWEPPALPSHYAVIETWVGKYVTCSWVFRNWIFKLLFLHVILKSESEKHQMDRFSIPLMKICYI